MKVNHTWCFEEDASPKNVGKFFLKLTNLNECGWISKAKIICSVLKETIFVSFLYVSIVFVSKHPFCVFALFEIS